MAASSTVASSFKAPIDVASISEGVGNLARSFKDCGSMVGVVDVSCPRVFIVGELLSENCPFHKAEPRSAYFKATASTSAP